MDWDSDEWGDSDADLDWGCVHRPINDDDGYSENFQKNLYTQIYSTPLKNHFLYTLPEHFFSSFHTYFNEVTLFEMAGRFLPSQSGDKSDQPAFQIDESHKSIM